MCLDYYKFICTCTYEKNMANDVAILTVYKTKNVCNYQIEL